MKKVSLFVNEKKDIGGKITEKTLELLKNAGICVDVISISDIDKKNEDELFSDSECVITLGGDGTILNVAPIAAKRFIPIVGINCGNVGFMAELEIDTLQMIQKLKNDEYTVSERMMLEVVTDKTNLLCLNECSVTGENGMKLVGMKVFEGGEFVSDLRADGVIFSTPTGSTGYSFSAGGAVIDPEMECIGMQTICSYYIKDSHQMIFKPDSEFKITGFFSDKVPVVVCADGQKTVTVQTGDVVTVKKSQYKTKLINFSKHSFHNVFYTKFQEKIK